MSDITKKCLVGAKYIDEIAELSEFGIEAIGLPSNPFLDEEINSHADILSLRINDDLLIDSNIAGEIDHLLKPYSVSYIDGISSPYPNDVKLNVAVLGKKIICNDRFVDNIVLQKAFNEYQVICTKQGYAKCNLCIINDMAVITEDDGLAYLLKNYQIDVLKISKGFVSLSEKHYGFIGGASAKISNELIYFSGDISSHPDYNEIVDFLYKYNFKPVFNKNRKLRDFGGLIIL